MHGRIPERVLAPLAIAAIAGAAAMLAPPLALLILAALAAHALLRNDVRRVNIAAITGPAFAALIVGAFAGLAGAIGVLFVWRLVADTRWSVAEAQRRALIAGRPAETSFKALAHAWATPLFGLTLVAFTAPHMIAGLPLDLPHVPIWVVAAAGIVAAGALFDWGLQRAADWRLGELSVAPTLHLLAHHAVFLLAFGLTIDVSAGVMMLAAWRLAHAAPFKLPQLSFTAVP